MDNVTKLPMEWSEIFGVRILDPDGWRSVNSPTWDTPITYEDFRFRMSISTVMVNDTDKFKSEYYS